MIAYRPLLALLVLSCIASCSRQPDNGGQAASQPEKDTTMQPPSTFVDEYLTTWDRFTQGDKDLVPYLRDNKAKFEISLAQLLRTQDRGAMARLVFYPVVQVGGAIPADSDLGTAARQILGQDFPVTTTKQGQRVLFCADLYAWWQKHQQEFQHFKTFDDWLARDFAQKTVLPMYKRLQEQTQ